MSFRETDKFKLSVVNNAYYLIEVKDDTIFEIEDMPLVVQFEKEICNRRMPILVHCPPTATSSSEFIMYHSKSENNPFATADAFVLSSVAQKILAHFSKLFVNHERPISFFNNKKDAEEWLKQFLD